MAVAGRRRRRRSVRCRSRTRSGRGWRTGGCRRCRRAAGRRRTGRCRAGRCSGAAGGGDELGQLLVGGLDLLVDGGEFVDQLRGQLAAGACPTMSRGRTVSSSARACGADRNFFAPPGISSSSSWCSRLTVSVRARPSSSRRSTSSRNATVVSSTATCRRPRLRSAGHGDAVRVDRVGLAALAGGEHPHPRGQLRRHVHHGLAVGDQPLGDVPADAVAALDRPDPVRDAAGRRRASPGSRRGRCRTGPARGPAPGSSMTSIVADRLCGSIPMITGPSLVLLRSHTMDDVGEEGSATSSWAYPS